MEVNFQMFKLDLEKAEEPQNKLPVSIGALKKQESSKKTSTSALLTMSKPLTVWITIASLPRPCPASSVRARKEQAVGVWET